MRVEFREVGHAPSSQCLLKQEIYADLVLSIGDSCRTAKQLSLNNLRKLSSPLDWMMSYTIESVSMLFETEFEYFFAEREVLAGHHGTGKHGVRDRQTGMIAKHHFPLYEDIDAYYPKFIQKMHRKFQRLHRYIIESENIVFVSNRKDDIESLQLFLFSMHRKYRKKFTLVNIRSQSDTEFREYELSNTLRVLDYAVDDSPRYALEHDWKGNCDVWKVILKQIILTNKHHFIYSPVDFE